MLQFHEKKLSKYAIQRFDKKNDSEQKSCKLTVCNIPKICF